MTNSRPPAVRPAARPAPRDAARRSARRRHALAVAVVGTSCLATAAPSFADLLSYYNFNSLTNSASATFPLTPTSGNGQLTYTPADGTTAATAFAGTTTNAVGTDVAGQALSLVGGTGNANNGAALDFTFSTTGFAAPVLTYATRASGTTGFTQQDISYSTDGVTFTPFSTVTGLTTAFALKTIDFSTVAALANKATVDIRFTFTGATSASGNNRLDNVQFNAGIVGGASGILTFDPAATAGGTASRLFTTDATVKNFRDSGLGTDVTFANGNTVNFTQAGVGTVTVQDGVAPAAVNVSNTSGTYSFGAGGIAGTVALTKTGAGTLALTAANSYGGGDQHHRRHPPGGHR